MALNFDVISDAPVINVADTPLFLVYLKSHTFVLVFGSQKMLQFVSFDDDYNVYEGLSLVGVLPKGNLARMNFQKISIIFIVRNGISLIL